MRVASRRTRFRLSLGLAVSLAVAALGVGSSLDAQEPPKFVTIQVNDPSGEGSVVFPNLIGGVITCFDTCMFEGPAGATWQFTAQGPNFSGWTGCTGVSGPDNRICDLLLGQETTITAAFGAAPPPPPPPPIPSNPLDFGDAPDSYKTLLASDGPRHALGLVGSYLGIFPPDFENDGHPTADATGDDLSGSADEPADEQGVTLASPLVRGHQTIYSVFVREVTTSTRLAAWWDLNNNGSFDTQELVVNSDNLPPTTQTLLNVPLNAPDHYFVRLRLGQLPVDATGRPLPTGQAIGGEVEDQRLRVYGDRNGGSNLDFGDAPRLYRTEFRARGAFHEIDPNLYLGQCVDHDLDGQPSLVAAGDDLDPFDNQPTVGQCVVPHDDEDGVTNFQNLVPGAMASVDVFSTGACLLSAWIDFERDGTWFGPGEQIFRHRQLIPGANPGLTFSVPASAAQGKTYARFRCFATTQTRRHPVRCPGWRGRGLRADDRRRGGCAQCARALPDTELQPDDVQLDARFERLRPARPCPGDDLPDRRLSDITPGGRGGVNTGRRVADQFHDDGARRPVLRDGHRNQRVR